MKFKSTRHLTFPAQLLSLVAASALAIIAQSASPSAAQSPLLGIRTVAHSDHPIAGLPPDVRLEAGALDEIFGLAGSNVAFIGASQSTPLDFVIWHQNAAGQMQIIARRGTPAPGLPTGYNFSGVASAIPNAAGDVVLYGQAFKPSEGFFYSLWTSRNGLLEIVAPPGSPAPGLPGQPFNGVMHMGMNDASQIAFLGTARETPTTLTTGIWSEGGGTGMQLVAAEGIATPGLPGEHFVFFESPLINPQGRVAFNTYITEQGTGIRRSLWTGFDYDDIQPVAVSGDQYDGLPNGEFRRLGNNPQIDAGGAVYFNASVRNASVELDGIWKWSGGRSEELMRQDLFVPYPTDPSISLAAIGDVAAGDDGTTAFPVLLAGTGVNESNDDAIVLRTPEGDVSLLIREGDMPAGWSEPTVFLTDPQVSINARGQVSFAVQFNRASQDPFIGTAILATDQAGNLQTIVRSGDVIDVDPGGGVDLRTVQSVLYGSNGSFGSGGGFTGGISNSGGQLSRFNNCGEVLFLATFNDGSAGFFVSNAVAVPEPTAIAMASLAMIACLGLAGSSRD